MFEKVNPSHPDKVADRIAGAIVDLAYTKAENPRVAVEVLIGHGLCTIINETSIQCTISEIEKIVWRITEQPYEVNYIEVPQDPYLSHNQDQEIRCGDNGIFKGVPASSEEKFLTHLAKDIYKHYPHDGKYIYNSNTEKLIICQSYASKDLYDTYPNAYINPLGEWTGGLSVDTGATNRKLGSDMGQSITGGGLHGKDLSKADVSLNIYVWLKAQELNKPVELFCAIGDDKVDGKSYSEIVEIARNYIKSIGGFEKFAEWGLLR